MRLGLEPGRDGERRGDQGAHREYRCGSSGGGADRLQPPCVRLAEAGRGRAGGFRAAIVLLDTPALALRAGDVLHLAIVRRLRANLAALDARQSMAANHYGIPVFRVS